MLLWLPVPSSDQTPSSLLSVNTIILYSVPPMLKPSSRLGPQVLGIWFHPTLESLFRTHSKAIGLCRRPLYLVRGFHSCTGPAQAAITKFHGLHGLNSRHLFLTVLEAGKLRTKLLSCCMLNMAEKERVRVSEWARNALVSLSLLIKALIPSRGSTFMASSQPNYHPNASHPNTITLGVRTSSYKFWRDINI